MVDVFFVKIAVEFHHCDFTACVFQCCYRRRIFQTQVHEGFGSGGQHFISLKFRPHLAGIVNFSLVYLFDPGPTTRAGRPGTTGPSSAECPVQLHHGGLADRLGPLQPILQFTFWSVRVRFQPAELFAALVKNGRSFFICQSAACVFNCLLS